MDFVLGGDYFTLMRKFKRLPEDWCRVYIAEISMALQHLHDMEIVYRDLKPGFLFFLVTNNRLSRLGH
jgi:serine/threonine protein kinase